MRNTADGTQQTESGSAVGQTPDRWSHLVDDYEAMFVGFSSRVALVALDHLRLAPGEHVLDVAAGTGALTLPALERGAQVTAIDRAPGMLDRLRSKLKGNAEVEVRQMDAMALDLEDDSFDCAASNLGVVLVDDPARGLAELRRVVRPGGRVVVTNVASPQKSTLWQTIVAALASVGANPVVGGVSYERYSHPEGLSTALRDGGFHEVRVEEASVPWVVEDPGAFWRRWGPAVAPPVAAAFAAISPEKIDAAGATFVRLVEEAHGEGPAVFPTNVLVGVGLA